MAYFAPVFLVIIAYFLGNLVQTILRDRDSRLPETILLGTLSMLILWEIIVLPAIKLLASFQLVCKIYSGCILVLILISALAGGSNIRRQLTFRRLYEPWPFVGALGILLMEICFVFILAPDRNMDFTVETVNTTLVSDLIYENHPGMGSTFLYGITFRGKIVTLPLLYAYLVRVFGGTAAVMVYRIIPAWMLILNAFAYWNLGSYILGKRNGEWSRGFLFVMGIGLMNIFGSFAKNCIFYYQMYRGFRGETFVYGIMLPYCLYLCSRLLAAKDFRAGISLALLMLASLTVTDYQRGFIPMVISVLVSMLLLIIYQIRRWIRCRK